MSEQKAESKTTILVVDDTPDNLNLISSLLRKDYVVRVATNGERALQIARSESPPSLILLDIIMPGMDGYETCRLLKGDPKTEHIAVIFLSAMSDVEDQKKGFAIGAADYITKPISPPILEARVKAHLAAKTYADLLSSKAEYLEAEVARRVKELTTIQDVTIQALAALAETRDSDTGNHIRRTQHYVRILTEQLKGHPRFASYLTPVMCDLLFKSAPLHDIGKVGIPDHILLKPGRFEPAEFEIMKLHTTLGRDALQSAEDTLGLRVEFLSVAKEIAYSHQEKWDGSGYPVGLAGDAIPASARLMALADVYDALICRRIYKEAFSHEKATEIIQQGRGSHFDPDVTDAFLAVQYDFVAIAEKFRDSDEDLLQKMEQLALLRA